MGIDEDVSDSLVKNMRAFIKTQEKWYSVLKAMTSKGINKEGQYKKIYDKIDPESAWWASKRKVAKHIDQGCSHKKGGKKAAKESKENPETKTKGARKTEASGRRKHFCYRNGCDYLCKHGVKLSMPEFVASCSPEVPPVPHNWGVSVFLEVLSKIFL
jgi:hypothetical protein